MNYESSAIIKQPTALGSNFSHTVLTQADEVPYEKILDKRSSAGLVKPWMKKATFNILYSLDNEKI